MKTNVVFTFIGDDKQGLVESISRIVNENHGNWLASRLSQLAGKFAGIIQVEVDDNEVETLTDSLKKLQDMGLTIVIEKVKKGSGPFPLQTRRLTLLGLDRPGILRDVAHALAGQGINVLELDTRIVKAAMTGKPMFDASAIVEYGADTDHAQLTEDLDRISTSLGVDIELSEET